LLIRKYSDKQKENNLEIIKTFFKILKKEDREKLEDLQLKAKVIKQNITLLKMKKTGKSFSYTRIIK
jgi:predicted CopG family antitoxin